MRPASSTARNFSTRDAAGFDVDLDDRHMAGVGERTGRIVVRAFAQARRDLALEAVRLMVSGAREIGERHGAVGPQNLGATVFQNDIVSRRLQNVARDNQKFFADLSRRQH